MDAHFVGEAEKQIGRRLRSVLHEAAGIEFAAAMAGEENGKIVVGVAIAVRIATAEHDHRIVEKGVAGKLQPDYYQVNRLNF